jgi:hypothetical protein
MTEEEYRDGSPFLIYAPGSIQIADLRNSSPAESPETDEEFTANADLIKAAPSLFHALNNLQANPNDPRAHRQALDALKLANPTP